MSNTAEIINFPNKTEQPGGRMADLSNGYTKVANEIQQLKPRLRLSGREWQCFEAVIWLTYGWNKKQDRVTNTVIAELTGLSDTHVSDALKSLAERKIIFSQKQGMMKIVGVNTDLSAWILDKPETGRKFPKTGKSFPKSGITFPKTVDTQYKNKNSIKRSSSENSDESSDARLKKFLSTHPEAAVYTPSGAKWGSAEDLETAKWISSRVKLINPEVLKSVMAAMIQHENGAQPYSEDEIRAAIQTAISDPRWSGLRDSRVLSQQRENILVPQPDKFDSTSILTASGNGRDTVSENLTRSLKEAMADQKMKLEITLVNDKGEKKTYNVEDNGRITTAMNY
ncbi:replication protein [Escherichia coli]|uniref:replication protein n=7 Tax=Bacteria TaxID=2 RepID=UPI00390C292C